VDSDFQLGIHHKPFVGRPDPLGELTALPKHRRWIGEGPQRGVQEDGKVKRGRRQRRGDIWRKGREGKGREWEGKGDTEEE